MTNGYLEIKRKWKRGDVVTLHFDMPVRTVVANRRVAADRGRIAVERGPLVYCAEWADNTGVNPHHVLMPRRPQFRLLPLMQIENKEAPGSGAFHVTAIDVTNAQEASINEAGRRHCEDVHLRLIPYYAWNHRGQGSMTVWLPQELRATTPVMPQTLSSRSAINASFKTAGVSGAAAHIALFPYDQSKWQECIGVEKWKALAGVNGFEGYTEARRLDYPQFGSAQGKDMYAGSGGLDLTVYEPNKLYTPFKRFDLVGDNHLLERFPYPESSTSRNSNAPSFSNDMYLKPIFWGK